MVDVVLVVHVYIVHFMARWQNVHLTRAHEDAVVLLTLKVALAFDGAVILAGLCVELNADPHARGERGLADEQHFAIAQVGDADARMQVDRLRGRHGCSCSRAGCTRCGDLRASGMHAW